MRTSTVIRGLGVALIVAAVAGCSILLLRSDSGQKTPKKDGSGNYTTEAPLAKQSEAVPEGTEDLVAEQPSAEATATPAPSATPEPAITVGPSLTAAPDTGSDGQLSNNDTDTDSQDGEGSKTTEEALGNGTASPASAETVTVEIKKGDNSAAVAQRLEEAGVVDDADAFNAYLEQGGYSNRLIVGSYKLTPGESYASLAKTLAGQSK